MMLKTKIASKPSSAAQPESGRTKRTWLVADRRKEQILDAAQRALLHNSDATLADVAKEAGISRQLIALYFPGGGIDPLRDLLFERFTGQFQHLLKTAMTHGPKNMDEARALFPAIIAGVFDLAKTMRAPWLFAGEASGMSRTVGLQRVKARADFARIIGNWLGAIAPDTPATRAVLRAEIRATDELVWLVLSGKMPRQLGERLAIARLTAIVEYVLAAGNMPR
jgi:AcrR family transcriptional regulator